MELGYEPSLNRETRFLTTTLLIPEDGKPWIKDGMSKEQRGDQDGWARAAKITMVENEVKRCQITSGIVSHLQGLGSYSEWGEKTLGGITCLMFLNHDCGFRVESRL